MAKDGPRPFIKWAGGKRALADRILALGPKKITRYIEPFVGGGAVFFALRKAGFDGDATLGDTILDLVIAYERVRDDPKGLISALRSYVNEEENYYVVRSLDPTTLGLTDRASRFIYLNKTSFNGLWRENKSGKMNAPYGKYKNPTICDEPGILAAYRALQDVNIQFKSFGHLYLDREVGPGDFIYCDPPYLPVSKSASFTTYSAGGFGYEEHRKLMVYARRWAMRGARVVLSNADVPLTHELYEKDFSREIVQMNRSINCKGEGRSKVGEVILSIGDV